MTHSSASARSRSDLQHIAEQFVRKLAAVALNGAPMLSNHRAVLFSRSRPDGFLEGMRPIQLHIVKHEGFPHGVALHYRESLKNHRDTLGIQKLVFLKESMREVCRHPVNPSCWLALTKKSVWVFTSKVIRAFESRSGIRSC